MRDILERAADLDEVAQHAVERAQAVCAAERALVEVIDGEGVIHRAKAGTWPTSRSGAAPPQPWRTLSDGATWVSEDTETDPRVDRQVCRRLGARSLISVPLRRGHLHLGTATVTSSQPGAFTTAQTEALQSIAAEVKAAAVRARVDTELRETCQRCEGVLVASEARFRRLFFENPQPMWVLDAETQRFLAVNDAAVARYGYSPQEFAALTITALRHDATHLSVDFNRARLRRTAFKARHRLRDGRLIDVEITAMPQEYDGRPGVLSIVNDVTERNRLERELRIGAFRDPLTGGANRALFAERLGHALARVQRKGAILAVLFIDLDSFKSVNDSLGYHAGDAVLQAAAARLASTLRPGDTVARLSADEFAVLLEEVDRPSDPLEAAESLSDAFRAPLEVAGNSLVIGLSMGIATSSTALTSADELLRNAELAMHAAKAEGRGRVEVFVPTMHATAAGRLSLEQDLRHAVERGELRVLFQPVVSVEAGTVAGCEALVRWHHPSRGLVHPDQFIALAEETGLISAIDTWVLHEACVQAGGWRAKGLPPLLLSVNASGRDLGRGDLVDRVSGVLLATGFPHHQLEIEITENSAVAQPAEALNELRRLREAGITVAIDDFGTGYSSLSKLATYPVDRLKIDRSFISDIRHEHDDTPLVAAMIALAHRLGMAVTAEGVETAEQLAFLRRNGCDLFQGYLFSPPVTAERFEELLQGQRRSAPVLSAVFGRRRAPDPGDELLERTAGRATVRRGRARARPLRAG